MMSGMISESSLYCREDTWTKTNNTSTLNSNHYTVDFSFSSIRWIAYSVIAPVIITGGIIGNILNLIVLTRPDLRGVTYVYLTGLAVADLGVMLSVIPMTLRLNQLHSVNLFGAFFHAHGELVLTNSFMATSVFIVCCMTVDRYISVCLPTKFRSVHTKQNARIAIVFSYLFGVFISSPLSALKTVCKINLLQNDTVYLFQENINITTSFLWIVYLWTSETVVRFGPALMLAVLNILIINKFRSLTAKRKRFHAASHKFRTRHLLDSTSTAEPSPNGVRNRNYYEEKRLIILLTSIIVMFITTMTPAALLSLLYTEQLDSNIGFQAFRAAANNLEFVNFALNFYIYFFCSKEFRKVFSVVLTMSFLNKPEDI